jgi:PAS domain S-box-containing protein
LDVLQGRRSWPDVLVSRLQLVGQVLLTALGRVRAEHDLAASREFAQAVTEASPHIVYVFDISEMRLVYASPQVEHELGRTQREAYALGLEALLKLLHPEDQARFPSLIAGWTGETEDAPREELIRLKHADGSWRWFATRDRVFQRNPDGSPKQLIGTMRDVTEQRKAEEELQGHRDNLIHVGRLSSMGEMVAGIAHELGQPLYSIMNYTKASQNVIESQNIPELQETQEWLEKIEKAASRAGEIIRRFRTFARRTSTQRESVDIRGVIRDAIDLLSYELRQHNVQVATTLPEQPLLAKADRLQVLQTCVNLLQNASEAMSTSAEDQRAIEIHASSHDDQVLVTIADRGEGLPENEHRIFEAFVSSKPDGLGMGLAICKTIVEQHGGTIWADANPAGGAVFSFTLLIAKDSSKHDDA